jgi:hypothetical protein
MLDVERRQPRTAQLGRSRSKGFTGCELAAGVDARGTSLSALSPCT